MVNMKKNQDVYKYNFIEKSNPETGFGVRHIQIFLLFMCCMTANCIRVCMSIGIVAMTNKSSENDNILHFEWWNRKVQNLVLSSFFIGYMTLQIPAGVVTTKFGGKRPLAVALFVNGGLCLIIPWMVKVGGWKALVIVRILQGMSQGLVYPSFNTLLGKWAPYTERSRLSNCIYAATSMSSVIAMPVSGYLASSFMGWPSIFYLFGTIATVVGCFWIICGADSPRQHKYISDNERRYIENSLGVYTDYKVDYNKKEVITPWRSIFTSAHVMALCIAHIGSNFVFLTLLLEIPTYIKEVYHIDMRESGWMTSLPYLAMWLISVVFSFLADYLVNNNLMNLTNVRKMCNTIGNLGPAILVLLLCLIPTNQTTLAIAVITVTVGCTGANNVGFLMNHVDLSPNFSGILFGFTNMMANLLALIAPNIVGFVVTDSNDPSEWNAVFYVTAAVCFFSCLIYLLYGSAEKQSWDELVYTKDFREIPVEEKV